MGNSLVGLLKDWKDLVDTNPPKDRPITEEHREIARRFGRYGVLELE